jgi:15-cis-phytoene synthase
MSVARPDGAGDAGAAIRAGSRSFALASRLFDPVTRAHVWDLYAWCRHLDDVVDGQVLGHARHPVRDGPRGVAELREQSMRALAGDASGGPVFAGLARVSAATHLPAAYVRDHLAGFEMDADGRRYETVDDTLAYCYHVAGVVGLMMAWIMGVRDEPTLLRGCDLGLAFQLTNIARDVDDDARHGRVYLPGTWLREREVILMPGQPMGPETRVRVVPVVARLLDLADGYYQSAWHGVARLPWRSAWSVATARHVYADIGHEVRRRGATAWDTRVVVSRSRKIARVAQALVESAWAVAVLRRTPAPERRGLWTPPAAAHARLRS